MGSVILDWVVGLKIILDWVVGLFFGCGFYATFEIYLLAWFLLGILDWVVVLFLCHSCFYNVIML